MLMELAKLVYARTCLAVREERGSQSIEWVAIGMGAIIIILAIAGAFSGTTVTSQITNVGVSLINSIKASITALVP